MNKEQQNKAWACLPKEAREEIKRLFSKANAADNYTAIGVFLKIFGNHNLTSDTEPEEMLMVERKKVIRKYKFANICDKDHSDKKYWEGAENTLIKLFGDKCLPDKEPSVQDEPKFKVRDKVRLNFEQYKDGEYDTIDTIIKSDYSIYLYHLKNDGESYAERYLEPYTEPEQKIW